jgi:FAD/FMN-containing dehydrogenase
MSSHKHPLGTVAELGEEAVGGLSKALSGELILPDHSEYNDARDVWNGLVNRYPAVVVRATGGQDVATAVSFAREHGLDLSVRGGAHQQAGDAVVDNGLVVDLSECDEITVDPERQVATVGPGNRAEDVLAETQEYGLAMPTGSAGCVGIPGTTLNGGVGWIRRKHGLSVDALRSMEVVTADGSLVEASPDTNTDLFWAMRGGDGNFGVVTNFEFDLYEVGPVVVALNVFYPADIVDEVLRTYRDFAADAPEELTTIVNYGEIPAIPPMPDHLHGEEAVGLIGCYTGDPEEGMETVAPLREVGDPLIDASDVMPYEALHEVGTLMHPWGRKYINRSVFVDELTEEVRNLVVDRTDAAPGVMDGVGLWSMGGAVGSGHDAAFAWPEKRFMVVIEAAWEDTNTPDHIKWAQETERLFREAGGEGAYAGYAGVEEADWEDWTEKVYADSYPRLQSVKAEYDPENVFSHNLNVDPSVEGSAAD